jgi:hypothetical protein
MENLLPPRLVAIQNKQTIKIPRINAAQKPQIPKITWLRRGSKFTQMMESHIIEMAKPGSIYKVSNLLRIIDT